MHVRQRLFIMYKMKPEYLTNTPLIDEIENQDETIQEMLNFLTDWLIHHILELDTQIGK